MVPPRPDRPGSHAARADPLRRCITALGIVIMGIQGGRARPMAETEITAIIVIDPREGKRAVIPTLVT